MKLQEILKKYTVAELRGQCVQYRLFGYSKLKKVELVQQLTTVMLSDDFLDKFFLAIDEKAFRSFERLVKGKKNISSNDLMPFIEVGYANLQQDGSVQIAEELQSFTYARFDAAFYKRRKQIQKINDYFNAFANLYGILPGKEMLSFLKEYEGLTEINEIYDAYKILSLCRHFYFWVEGDIVAEALIKDEEEYLDVRQGQIGKPYAHLSKNELLKYADGAYAEKTPQYFEMTKFMQDAFQLSAKRSAELTNDIVGFCQAEAPFSVILGYIEDRGCSFNQFDQNIAMCFMSLYTDLYNNTRLWSNCGYSPNMMSQILTGRKR